MEFQPEIARIIRTTLLSGLARTGGGSPAPANRPDLHGDLPGLPAALGRGMARIHSAPLPTGAVSLDLRAAMAVRVEAGLVDPVSMPEPYSRYDAAALLDLWERSPSIEESPVVTVGRLTIDRLLLESGEVVDVEGEEVGLVADRHLDLAVLHQSIHNTLGAEAVFGFYEAYGADPSLVLLDRFVLASYLLGWLPAEGAN